MEEVMKIEKDNNGSYWLNYPDDMPDHLALGILQILLKRMENHIITTENKLLHEQVGQNIAL